MLSGDPLKVPILMYHEIIDEGADNIALLRLLRDSYVVGRDVFEDQLAYLGAGGYHTATLAELTGHMQDPLRNPLPEHSVVLTFDDGYVGNYTWAFPLLKKYSMTAVFFVASRLIGMPLMMHWAHLREMSAAGMSIQSHTASHPFLKQLSDEAVARELRESKVTIQNELGVPVDYLSLPNGSYGASCGAIAAGAGYAGVCSSVVGYNVAHTDRFLLRRIRVSGNHCIDEFKQIVAGKGWTVRYLQVKYRLKTFARALIGERLYFKLYRLAFGLRKLHTHAMQVDSGGMHGA